MNEESKNTSDLIGAFRKKKGGGKGRGLRSKAKGKFNAAKGKGKKSFQSLKRKYGTSKRKAQQKIARGKAFARKKLAKPRSQYTRARKSAMKSRVYQRYQKYKQRKQQNPANKPMLRQRLRQKTKRDINQYRRERRGRKLLYPSERGYYSRPRRSSSSYTSSSSSSSIAVLGATGAGYFGGGGGGGAPMMGDGGYGSYYPSQGGGLGYGSVPASSDYTMGSYPNPYSSSPPPPSSSLREGRGNGEYLLPSPSNLGERGENGGNEGGEEEYQQTPHPFSQNDLASLAHHGAISQRCIKMLEGVDHEHLRRVLDARDDFERETDPNLRAKKSAVLVSMLDRLDERYHTFSKVWGRIVQNRPSTWGIENSYLYADSVDVETAERYYKMSDLELSSALAQLSPTQIEEVKAMGCGASSIGAHIGCPVIPPTSDSTRGLDLFHRVTFYQGNRKYDMFSNGFVKGTSTISEAEATARNIRREIELTLPSENCFNELIFALLPWIRRYLVEFFSANTNLTAVKENAKKFGILDRIPVPEARTKNKLNYVKMYLDEKDDTQTAFLCLDYTDKESPRDKIKLNGLGDSDVGSLAILLKYLHKHITTYIDSTTKVSLSTLNRKRSTFSSSSSSSSSSNSLKKQRA